MTRKTTGFCIEFGIAVVVPAPVTRPGRGYLPEYNFQRNLNPYSRYIVLNRTGSANQLFAASRGFDPFLIYDEIK